MMIVDNSWIFANFAAAKETCNILLVRHGCSLVIEKRINIDKLLLYESRI